MLELNFKPFPKLITDRLILRELKNKDANQILFLRSDERVNKFLERKKAKTKDDAVNFIRKIEKDISNDQCIYWAITLKDCNTLIGTICFFNFDYNNEKAEIGYELHPDYEGKGIMQEAITKVITFGFEILKIKTIVAFTSYENDKSIKLLKKNNFRFDTNSKFGLLENSDDLKCYYLQNTIAENVL